METRCCKVCFENPQKKKSAEDTLVPPLREKREKKCYYSLFVHAAVRGGTCAFTSKNCQHADQKQLTRRLTFDLDIESTNSQPASCRARPMNGRCRPRRYRVDPWYRRREVARGVLRSSPKPEKSSTFCHRRDRHFLSPVFYTPAANFFCIRRLAGARYISPTVVWTLRVGASNECAPFRFHGVVVGFSDRRLSRTRNLAGSN